MISNYIASPAEAKLCLLMVEPDLASARELTDWLRQHDTAAVHASTAHEAALAISDAAFTQCGFAGLLLDVNLPDTSGYRVMSAFRDEFPGRLVAAMTRDDDLCLKLWCKARRIPLYCKPFVVKELHHWLGRVKESMHPLDMQVRLRGKLRRTPSDAVLRNYALGF